MNKRHYEHTLPNIRGSLSNTYSLTAGAAKSNWQEKTTCAALPTAFGCSIKSRQRFRQKGTEKRENKKR